MQGKEVQFAPVAPIHLLEGMFEHELETGNPCLGGYHLLLAHDVMESHDKQTRFHDLMDSVRDYYTSAHIIMDNSVVELGDAVEMDWVVDAARFAQANVIVIPDAMSDWTATVTKFQSAADRMPDGTRKEFEFMFVPQGRTMSEFVRCVEAVMSSHPDFIDWIGIPRVAREQHDISRVSLTHMIDGVVRGSSHSKYAKYPVKYHLLGFSNDVLDDIEAARLGIAEGIDSAVPIRAGQVNRRFYASTNDYGKRGDYWTSEKTLSSLAINNMEYFRRLIRT